MIRTTVVRRAAANGRRSKGLKKRFLKKEDRGLGLGLGLRLGPVGHGRRVAPCIVRGTNKLQCAVSSFPRRRAHAVEVVHGTRPVLRLGQSERRVVLRSVERYAVVVCESDARLRRLQEFSSCSFVRDVPVRLERASGFRLERLGICGESANRP